MVLATSAYLNGLEGATDREETEEILRKIGYWHIYNTRPDNQAQGFGDEGPRVDLKDETRRVIDLITQATNDPILAAYSQYLGELHKAESYYREYRWGFPLFNNPFISPTSRSTPKTLEFAENLPKTALFGKGAMNMAYIRSGWSPLDTFISYRAGNTFTHHGHYDAGHFTLFKGAPLVTSSGTYGGFSSEHRLDYAIRTISKNSLLVMKPEEKVKPNHFFKESVSAGGQRITMPTGSAITSTAMWREQLHNNRHLEGGELLAFEGESERYQYISSDLTAAYNNTEYDENGDNGKIQSVTRQLFYLTKEDQLFIHDRVVSTNASFTKKWLLHTINQPEISNTKVLIGNKLNGILESMDSNAFIKNKNGRLRVDRVYPKQAKTRLIGGPDYQFYVEIDGDDTDLDGKNMSTGANKKPWFENSLWRMEIQPATPQLENHFLIALSSSLNTFRKDKASRLDTKGSRAHATRSASNLIIFVEDQARGKISLQTKGNDQHLYLIGVQPHADISLSANQKDIAQKSSQAGVVSISLRDLPAGKLNISWKAGNN